MGSKDATHPRQPCVTVDGQVQRPAVESIVVHVEEGHHRFTRSQRGPCFSCDMTLTRRLIGGQFWNGRTRGENPARLARSRCRHRAQASTVATVAPDACCKTAIRAA